MKHVMYHIDIRIVLIACDKSAPDRLVNDENLAKKQRTDNITMRRSLSLHGNRSSTANQEQIGKEQLYCGKNSYAVAIVTAARPHQRTA